VPFALFAALCVFCVESFLLSPHPAYHCMRSDPDDRATMAMTSHGAWGDPMQQPAPGYDRG
jgi:hypothetical protein